MKVAISTDGEFVSEHFGRCPLFTLADLNDGKVENKVVIDNPGHHPGFLPQYLSKQGVSVVIAGGAGQRARDLFDQAGIRLFLGVSGVVDDVLNELASGTLQGGESFCRPKSGKGYGIDKTECDHPEAH